MSRHDVVTTEGKMGESWLQQQERQQYEVGENMAPDTEINRLR